MFTSEQLERFAEAGGWREQKSRNFDGESLGWHHPACKYAASTFVDTGASCAIGCGDPLPDFPNNLAACFDVLERFCEQRKLTWVVAKNQDGSIRCVLYAWPGQPFRRKRSASALGDTPQQAIISAVLAAEESK